MGRCRQRRSEGEGPRAARGVRARRSPGAGDAAALQARARPLPRPQAPGAVTALLKSLGALAAGGPPRGRPGAERAQGRARGAARGGAQRASSARARRAACSRESASTSPCPAAVPPRGPPPSADRGARGARGHLRLRWATRCTTAPRWTTTTTASRPSTCRRTTPRATCRTRSTCRAAGRCCCARTPRRGADPLHARQPAPARRADHLPGQGLPPRRRHHALADVPAGRGRWSSGPGITLGDLKGTIEAFLHALFGPQYPVRFRASFFPVHRAVGRGRPRLHRVRRQSGLPACARAPAGSRSWARAWSIPPVFEAVNARLGSVVYDPEQVTRLRVRPRHRARGDGAPRHRRHPPLLRERPALPGAVPR